MPLSRHFRFGSLIPIIFYYPHQQGAVKNRVFYSPGFEGNGFDMYNGKYVTAIIPAGGRGLRMRSTDGATKQFVSLCGVPVVARTLSAFERCPSVDAVVVAALAEEIGYYREVREKYGITKLKSVVPGGETRQISVENGGKAMPSETGIVVIHDAARCLVTPEYIERVIKAADESGAAIAAERSKDTVKISDGGTYISKTTDRDRVFLAKTPQAFLTRIYLKALEKASKTAVDDASLCEAAGIKVRLVECGEPNIKLTLPEDVPVAEAIIRQREGRYLPFRAGHGFDAHRLVEGRKLVLGGVGIPYEKGLDGHSDADVLTHAVCDALLGAAALGDIGKHFPPSDGAYKNICSLRLLEKTAEILDEAGFSVVNIDATVTAQAPKFAPYIDAMRANLAKAAGVPFDRVSVKATTEEHMGYTGRGEGISAHAVCMVAGRP